MTHFLFNFIGENKSKVTCVCGKGAREDSIWTSSCLPPRIPYLGSWNITSRGPLIISPTLPGLIFYLYLFGVSFPCENIIVTNKYSVNKFFIFILTNQANSTTLFYLVFSQVRLILSFQKLLLLCVKKDFKVAIWPLEQYYH